MFVIEALTMASSSEITRPPKTPTFGKVSTLRSLVFLLVTVCLRSHPVQGSVPTTTARTDAKRPNSVDNVQDLRIEETKRQMLNILGIDELPQPRQGTIPHQYMIHIYNKMSSRQSGYKGINTIRGFVDVGHADSSRRQKFHQIYSFNISALPMSEKIKSARLRLLRLSTREAYRYAWAHGMSYRAKLYHRKPENYRWNGRIYAHTRLILLGSVLFDVREAGEWKVFNVFKALRTWQNRTNSMHSFEIQIESVKTGYLMPSYDFGLSEEGRAHNKRALLVSFTDDGRMRGPEDTVAKKRRKSKKRVPRKTNPDKKEKNRVKRQSKRRKRRKQLCSKKDLYVDFALLGWSDWIMAPRGYNAYFCQGVCKFPIPAHLKPTNHAMVQTTVHSLHRRRVPPACCVPHELSGLSMLYIDKGDSVVYKKYENMVVQSCGCK